MFRNKTWIKRIYWIIFSKSILVNTDLEIYALNIPGDSLIMCPWEHIYKDTIDVSTEERSEAGKFIHTKKIYVSYPATNYRVWI